MRSEDQQKRDEAVLETVLRDLLTCKEAGLPFSLPPAPRGAVFFNPDPCEYLEDNPQSILEYWGAWKKLSAMERRAVAQATVQLVARKKDKHVFAHYRPQHPKVKIVRTTERGGRAKPYQANYPIQAGAPGYSSDGKYAVLVLFFPELWHSSHGTYVLVRRQDGWQVLCRAFITYL